MKEQWAAERSEEARTALFVEPLRALGTEAIRASNFASNGDGFTASLVNAARYHTLDVTDFSEAEKSQKIAYQSAVDAAKATDTTSNDVFGKALAKLVKVKETESGLAYFVVARGSAADAVRRKFPPSTVTMASSHLRSHKGQSCSSKMSKATTRPPPPQR